VDGKVDGIHMLAQPASNLMLGATGKLWMLPESPCHTTMHTHTPTPLQCILAVTNFVRWFDGVTVRMLEL